MIYGSVESLARDEALPSLGFRIHLVLIFHQENAHQFTNNILWVNLSNTTNAILLLHAASRCKKNSGWWPDGSSCYSVLALNPDYSVSSFGSALLDIFGPNPYKVTTGEIWIL